MPQRIIKEHLPGIIKEQEYRDIKWTYFSKNRLKTIATSLSIINKLHECVTSMDCIHDFAHVALTSKFLNGAISVKKC